MYRPQRSPAAGDCGGVLPADEAAADVAALSGRRRRDGAGRRFRIYPRIVAATLVGGALSIGASGTFNHVLERDVDKRMQRTNDRPLATDLVPVSHALAFGELSRSSRSVCSGR